MARKTSSRSSTRTAEKRPFAAASPALPAAAIQYTVRNIPAKADAALRQRAAELKLSLNEVLRLAMVAAAGLEPGARKVHHDLDHIIGTWVEDPEFDEIIAEHDRTDKDMWK